MEKRDYRQFYQKITGRIRENGAACFALRAFDRAATALMYVAYPLLLALLWRRGLHARLLCSILAPGISFAVLTAVRARINRPRPYEAWEISPLIRKETKGNSMPSRHVFSSAVIAMAWLGFCPPAGTAFLLVSAAAALVRVAGGVHYPSDVAVGFAAGVAAGLFILLPP